MSDESGPLTPKSPSSQFRELREKLVSAPVTLGPIHPDPLREAQQQRRRDRDQYYAGQAIAQGMDPEAGS